MNTLEAGSLVLMCETGHFATLWKQLAENLGYRVELIPGDWRHGADPAAVEERLGRDRSNEIGALAVVHNETSTGAASRIPEIRVAIDRSKHPALLLVDTVSSLACLPYFHDDWGVDVTVCGSQKGLMLPPGLGFNAVSRKALAREGSRRSYWDWRPILDANKRGFFPYTPATNLLFGLRESLAMLEEEGLENVFARHARHAEATRRAVRAWGLEVLCLDEREYSASLTAVLASDADAIRARALERFDLSLGTGLGKLQNHVFRIGHLGWFNDLMLCGTLCGVEMSLGRAGGVQAAMGFLAGGP